MADARLEREHPKPDDLVTWSGARDAKGYATGYGTLIWFAPQNEVETGVRGGGVAAAYSASAALHCYQP